MNLQERIAALSTEKRELLLQCLGEQRAQSKQITSVSEKSSTVTIKRLEQTEGPLSFAQERLWFLDQLEPGNSAYNDCFAVRFSFALDVNILRKSLSHLVQRHEALRTTFSMRDGQPVQIVKKSSDVKQETDLLEFKFVDFQKKSGSEQNAKVQALAGKEAGRAFDLEHGPLVRVILIQLRDNEYILVFVIHHIVGDGWSYDILRRELAALYEAFANGSHPSLPELPILYTDFAYWQRKELTGESIAPELAYWKQKLSGNLPVLELPTDYIRPAIQTYHGAKQTQKLSKRLEEALNTLSKQQGVTLFMTLITAYKILLYRYTNQEDILVGVPIANRNHAELENLVGNFVNTLVLRSTIIGNIKFCDFLKQVRETSLEAFAHQQVSFEKLVEELQPERNLSNNPLFQVMFNFQPATRHNSDSSENLTVTHLEIDRGAAMFDLTLTIIPVERELIVEFEYNTDLFKSDTIRRMMGNYFTLLENIVADPKQRISELPLLTEAERHHLLVEWNDTKTDYPRDLCIHELFEAQVQQTPDAIAVVFEDEQLSYWELNCRANQLARYLKKRGVGPEALVGICVQRSLDMVIGLLGILKAGGAYVPLDPSYPGERLAFMLDDAKISVLLTQYPLNEVLAEHRAHKVYLDKDWKNIARESRENFDSKVNADNLAYVIYTSGSTGKPKGVAIEHHSTVALIYWAREVFTPEDLTGVMASTSISFDLSVFELFVPLSWGGKVFVVENVLHLPDLSRANDITLINTVPSAIAELLMVGGLPASVRTVNLAGEPLQNTLVQKIYLCETIEQVFDLYGPSEDTTYSTFALRSANGIATIGRPIANTQIYLLDENLQLVPVGVTGELYIGGDGLARGYLNRPDLTAEKFIPSPFSNESHARLYKTGDLARFLPDGNIVFLGRKDHQIKLRGFRIELGEIETILNQHSSLKQVVVLLKETGTGDKRLIGYLTVNPGSSKPTPTELRDYLREKLPDYMVPAEFAFLGTLPLTPNGKIDRKKLLEIETENVSRRDITAPPVTPLQKKIAKIWKDVTGVEIINLTDNFFDLGGHSLLAMKAIFFIEKETGYKVTPRDLMLQSLEQISARLTHATQSSIESLCPFYFGPESKKLFGVHHAPEVGGASKGGIVLCYPMGYEYVRAHQAFIQLARRLSEFGFHVLRFDFFATGDSAGDCKEGSVEQWLNDIDFAVDELRSLCRQGRISLIGLRFGATLAALVNTRRKDIERLVLWDPVVSGKRHLQEITKIHRVWLREVLPRPSRISRNKNSEILGFSLTERLKKELQQLDLNNIEGGFTDKLLLVASGKADDYTLWIKRCKAHKISFDYQYISSPDMWSRAEGFDSGLVPNRIIQFISSWMTKSESKDKEQKLFRKQGSDGDEATLQTEMKASSLSITN